MPVNTDPLQFSSKLATTRNFEAPKAPDINAASQGYAAPQRQVKEENTVQGRLNALLEPSHTGLFSNARKALDTPSRQIPSNRGSGQYLQTARRKAAEEATRRGLLNSSIAAGAGEAAAIRAALPIARQDSATLASQQLANQKIESDVQKMRLGTQLGSETDRYKTQLNEYAAESNNQRQQEIMNLESALKQDLAAKQQEYAIELEKLQSGFDLKGNLDSAKGRFYSDLLKSLSNLLGNPDLTAQQQQRGTRMLIGNAKRALEFLQGLSNTPRMEPL